MTSEQDNGARPNVSIVMPTYNRREQALKAVRALTGQQADEAFEIVVVSDGSTDGTEEALRSIDAPLPLHVLKQENQGPAAARNRGLEEAVGDLVIFIDDDLVASDGLVQAHIDAHRRFGPDTVVIGPMLEPPDFELQPWVRWEQTMLDKQYAAIEAGEWGATARQFYTGNASLDRKRVLEVGGFDTSFTRAEDVELAYRLDDAGLRFEYLGEAVGYHYAQRSFASWRSIAYTYGRNDVIFARDRGRDWIFPFMAEKYGQHQRYLRWLIAASVERPWLGRSVGSFFGVLARVAEPIGLQWVVRASLSCIYGVEYHRGIADELGSAEQFFDVVGAK